MNLKAIILFLYFVTSFIYSQPIVNKKTSSPEEIFINTNFNIIVNVDSIPPAILSKLVKFVYGKKNNFMANPNKPFNKTDLVDDNLPYRRIIFAGQSDKYFFIYYECGGIGYHLSFVMYDCSKSIPKLLLSFTSFKKFITIEELKSCIRDELPLIYFYDSVRSKDKKIIKNRLDDSIGL